MPRTKDLSGNKYGRAEVIRPYGKNKYGKTVFLCKCDCGKMFTTLGNSLQSGRTKSCGCLFLEKSNEKVMSLAKHNKSNTRLYNIWHTMKQRCYYEKHKSFNIYGGRGIRMCQEWRNNFQAFYDWAISNGYAEDLTIDRVDINGDYEPSNCRWVTMKEQSNNKRNNHLIEYNGKVKTVSQWADEIGIDKNVLYKRLIGGWSVQKAFTTPKKRKVG